MHRSVLFVLLVGCTTSTSVETSSDEVVGGRAERGYPAVGYLVKEGAEAPFCAATVIAKDRVVTAAHCVDQMGGERTSFGLGRFGGRRIAVKQTLRHASWSPDAAAVTQDWLHDVAVLTLAEPAFVRPVAIAGGRTASSCTALYVGYGRVTEGGRDVEDGYTGERKSTGACVEGHAKGVITARGDGGGLCWGDSGGPLLVGGEIAGVLHGHRDMTNPRCEVGNPVAFTSLADERDFLGCALEGRAALAPDMHCHWSDVLVRPLVDEGVVVPFSDGTLRPERAATRADWARWSALALKPAPKRAAPNLLDPPSPTELAAQVDTAIRGGMFDGVEEVVVRGRFRAGASMTRREAMTGLGGIVVVPPDDADADLDATLTRAEAAAMIAKARTNSPDE